MSQQTPTWGSIHSRQSRSDDKRHPLRASMNCRRHRFEGPQDSMLLQISIEYSKWIILRKRCINIRSMKAIRKKRAVRSRSLLAEAWFRSWASRCEIFGGRSDTLLRHLCFPKSVSSSQDYSYYTEKRAKSRNVQKQYFSLYSFFRVISQRPNSDAGQSPKRKNTTFRTRRKSEIKNGFSHSEH